ncbi:hypothetical protein J3A83DRAFT_1131035 [Scleroderma citrinum]
MYLRSPSNRPAIMNELVEARAELSRLEQKGQQLLKELLDVRAATDAQRTRIDVLVRERGRTIACLPTELLVWIFTLCIGPNSVGPDTMDQDVDMQRRQSAGVSRHWRDVILHSPILWNYIIMSPHHSPSLKTRLKRSYGAPLNILITGWWRPRIKGGLAKDLAIVIPYADRWSSLTIYGNSPASMAFVINKVNHMKFPSLRHVVFHRVEDTSNAKSPCLDFLSPTCSPTLEHLVVRDFIPTLNLPTLSKLKTLDLMFENDIAARVPSIFFVQSLTTLSLIGDDSCWSLEQDSIQFPVLQTLILHITDPNQFMEAIVAPVLDNFDFSTTSVDNPDSVAFSRLRNKFSAVRCLTFDLGDKLRGLDDTRGIAICQAFPDVRRVEIYANDVQPIFAHSPKPGSQGCLLSSCNNLELLVIRFSFPKWSRPEELHGIDSLVEWLTGRIDSGQGRLRVKLSEIFEISDSVFTMIYNRLRKCCILELDDIPIELRIRLSTSIHFPLRLVSTLSCQFNLLNRYLW